ncbi:RsmE family RNA methyltransferase [Urbifossiella limnaea]|uniref:Ribosomal RNA small subunit methyltransferase E n=1 Tax=Urbifossiella limnaea TaxID=2528023 RepID=A0A517XTQ4_9BACT|nr:RsmE family RNA methyltransferase [Urbifossiella limnaea]QDU20891.1 Ribosomal RNA small subunit methyltransferase E [Urbifossiella limnaea]
MADRFYTPDALPPGEYVLTGPEAHHLAAVRRFGPGDRVVLFNGDGADHPAEVVAADRKRTLLHVHPAVPVDRELPFPLELAVALPKGDRGDFLVEKLTELGVSRFTPLVTERTIVQPKEARLEKLQHAVIEASKQCGRNVLMRVAPLTTWGAFLASADLPPRRLILHTAVERMPLGAASAGGVVIAVGPEGGFTDAEVEAATGWARVGLGPRVLRVETAAVAAAAWAAHAAVVPPPE